MAVCCCSRLSFTFNKYLILYEEKTSVIRYLLFLFGLCEKYNNFFFAVRLLISQFYSIWFLLLCDMPALIITTNASFTDEVLKELLPQLSKSVAEALHKPEHYMCVGVTKASMMIFGGSDEPCAFTTLSSIGSINRKSNEKVSAIVCDLLQKYLKVAPSRTCKYFNSLPFSIYLQVCVKCNLPTAYRYSIHW